METVSSKHMSKRSSLKWPLSKSDALALADASETAVLMSQARDLRDQGFANLITYSPKVFIPLTHLCRDVCHYCTFATTPSKVVKPYLSVDEVLETVRGGQALGCKEVLFTLGELPELRYRAAKEALDALGFRSTLEYVQHVAARVLEETGLLPHINAGCMSRAEMIKMKKVSASMGLMLESASERLCEKGMPHYGSPDKQPARRLATLELAGELGVPFTTGILIGIGETRRERVESMLTLRDLHEKHGHLQELIVQNFRAKSGTKMAHAEEPDLNELLWTVAVARLIFGSDMSIQAPPNLSPGVLPQIVNAGINDWGGVSPLTPDFVNPEAPWPHLDKLARETRIAGKKLQPRLTIYPHYIMNERKWLEEKPKAAVLQLSDAEGYARENDWYAGESYELPPVDANRADAGVNAKIERLVANALEGDRLSEEEIVTLFSARDEDFDYICLQADALRKQVNGDSVAYVVNRNINYTNICYFKCQFCAFSKGKLSENLRGRPYNLPHEEIYRRVQEAWQRGATEVCMQGGIHPEYTGQTYLDILAVIKSAAPDIHIHAFSPLEVWQGAKTLDLPVEEYLIQLRDAGLKSLPGTAAEILDQDIRKLICPDKITSEEWLFVMETAHRIGLRTTATIMFGHLEQPKHWARHILSIRDLQTRTSGFTEFVPLPFVHRESPMYLKGRARKGPTFREAILMHAVSRLALTGQIDNIQASWVKLGEAGAKAALNAGANDLGGTLMNESISRAAGASHGQEMTPESMQTLIHAVSRTPRQRTTLYADAAEERITRAARAPKLTEIQLTSVEL